MSSDLVERVAREIEESMDDDDFLVRAGRVLVAILETHAIMPRELTEEMRIFGCRVDYCWPRLLAAAPDVLKE